MSRDVEFEDFVKAFQEIQNDEEIPFQEKLQAQKAFAAATEAYYRERKEDELAEAAKLNGEIASIQEEYNSLNSIFENALNEIASEYEAKAKESRDYLTLFGDTGRRSAQEMERLRRLTEEADQRRLSLQEVFDATRQSAQEQIKLKSEAARLLQQKYIDRLQREAFESVSSYDPDEVKFTPSDEYYWEPSMGFVFHRKHNPYTDIVPRVKVGKLIKLEERKDLDMRGIGGEAYETTDISALHHLRATPPKGANNWQDIHIFLPNRGEGGRFTTEEVNQLFEAAQAAEDYKAKREVMLAAKLAFDQGKISDQDVRRVYQTLGLPSEGTVPTFDQWYEAKAKDYESGNKWTLAQERAKAVEDYIRKYRGHPMFDTAGAAVNALLASKLQRETNAVLDKIAEEDRFKKWYDDQKKESFPDRHQAVIHYLSNRQDLGAEIDKAWSFAQTQAMNFVRSAVDTFAIGFIEGLVLIGEALGVGLAEGFNDWADKIQGAGKGFRFKPKPMGSYNSYFNQARELLSRATPASLAYEGDFATQLSSGAGSVVGFAGSLFFGRGLINFSRASKYAKFLDNLAEVAPDVLKLVIKEADLSDIAKVLAKMSPAEKAQAVELLMRNPATQRLAPELFQDMQAFQSRIGKIEQLVLTAPGSLVNAASGVREIREAGGTTEEQIAGLVTFLTAGATERIPIERVFNKALGVSDKVRKTVLGSVVDGFVSATVGGVSEAIQEGSVGLLEDTWKKYVLDRVNSELTDEEKREALGLDKATWDILSEEKKKELFQVKDGQWTGEATVGGVLGVAMDLIGQVVGAHNKLKRAARRRILPKEIIEEELAKVQPDIERYESAGLMQAAETLREVALVRAERKADEMNLVGRVSDKPFKVRTPESEALDAALKEENQEEGKVEDLGESVDDEQSVVQRPNLDAYDMLLAEVQQANQLQQGVADVEEMRQRVGEFSPLKRAKKIQLQSEAFEQEKLERARKIAQEIEEERERVFRQSEEGARALKKDLAARQAQSRLIRQARERARWDEKRKQDEVMRQAQVKARLKKMREYRAKLRAKKYSDNAIAGLMAELADAVEAEIATAPEDYGGLGLSPVSTAFDFAYELRKQKGGGLDTSDILKVFKGLHEGKTINDIARKLGKLEHRPGKRQGPDWSTGRKIIKPAWFRIRDTFLAAGLPQESIGPALDIAIGVEKERQKQEEEMLSTLPQSPIEAKEQEDQKVLSGESTWARDDTEELSSAPGLLSKKEEKNAQQPQERKEGVEDASSVNQKQEKQKLLEDYVSRKGQAASPLEIAVESIFGENPDTIKQDIISAAQERLAQKLDTYDPNKGAFSTWAGRIVSSTGLNVLRAENTLKRGGNVVKVNLDTELEGGETIGGIIPSQEMTPLEALEIKEAHVQLDEALSKLPEKERRQVEQAMEKGGLPPERVLRKLRAIIVGRRGKRGAIVLPAPQEVDDLIKRIHAFIVTLGEKAWNYFNEKLRRILEWAYLGFKNGKIQYKLPEDARSAKKGDPNYLAEWQADNEIALIKAEINYPAPEPIIERIRQRLNVISLFELQRQFRLESNKLENSEEDRQFYANREEALLRTYALMFNLDYNLPLEALRTDLGRRARKHIEDENQIEVFAGGESLVFVDREAGKVYKLLLRQKRYGVTGYGYAFKRLNVLPNELSFQFTLGSPEMVAERIYAFNQLSNANNVIVLGQDVLGNIYLEQDYLPEEVTTQEEVDAWVTARGVRLKLDEVTRSNGNMGSIWVFLGEDGIRYVATDLRPQNFRRDEKGRMYPVDVVISPFPKELNLLRYGEYLPWTPKFSKIEDSDENNYAILDWLELSERKTRIGLDEQGFPAYEGTKGRVPREIRRSGWMAGGLPEIRAAVLKARPSGRIFSGDRIIFGKDRPERGTAVVQVFLGASRPYVFWERATNREDDAVGASWSFHRTLDDALEQARSKGYKRFKIALKNTDPDTPQIMEGVRVIPQRDYMRIEEISFEMPPGYTVEKMQEHADFVREFVQAREELQKFGLDFYSSDGSYYVQGLIHTGSGKIYRYDDSSFDGIYGRAREIADKLIPRAREYNKFIHPFKDNKNGLDRTGLIRMPHQIPVPIKDIKGYRMFMLFDDRDGVAEQEEWNMEPGFHGHAQGMEVETTDGRRVFFLYEVQESYRPPGEGVTSQERVDRLVEAAARYADSLGLPLVLPTVSTAQDIYGRGGRLSKVFIRAYGKGSAARRAAMRYYGHNPNRVKIKRGEGKSSWGVEYGRIKPSLGRALMKKDMRHQAWWMERMAKERNYPPDWKETHLFAQLAREWRNQHPAPWQYISRWGSEPDKKRVTIKKKKTNKVVVKEEEQLSAEEKNLVLQVENLFKAYAKNTLKYSDSKAETWSKSVARIALQAKRDNETQLALLVGKEETAGLVMPHKAGSAFRQILALNLDITGPEAWQSGWVAITLGHEIFHLNMQWGKEGKLSSSDQRAYRAAYEYADNLNQKERYNIIINVLTRLFLANKEIAQRIEMVANYASKDAEEFLATIYGAMLFKQVMSSDSELNSVKDNLAVQIWNWIKTLLRGAADIIRALLRGIASNNTLKLTSIERLSLANIEAQFRSTFEEGKYPENVPNIVAPIIVYATNQGKFSRLEAPVYPPEYQMGGGFWGVARKGIQRYLSTRGLFTERAYDEVVKSNKSIQALTKQIEFEGARLKRQLNQASKTFGEGDVAKQRLADLYELANMAIRGNETAKAFMMAHHPEIAETLNIMRIQVDKLSSELIKSGVVKGDLAEIIEKNLGVYLHRSYAIHHNPLWGKTLLKVLSGEAKREVQSEMVQRIIAEAESGAYETIVEANAREYVTKLIAEENKERKADGRKGVMKEWLDAENHQRILNEAEKRKLNINDPKVFGKLAEEMRSNGQLLIGNTSEAYAAFRASSTYKEWLERAKEHVRLSGQVTDIRVNALLQELIRANIESPFPQIRGSSRISKDLSTLMRRKNLPEWLRNLYGEYKDPTVNYMRTAFKLSSLLSRHRLLTNLRDMGLEEGWIFPTREAATEAGMTNAVKLWTEETKSMSPLSGYYGPPEFFQALKDLDNPTNRGIVASVVSKLIGYAMATKTSYSVRAMVRNFLGNVLFPLANGQWRMSQRVLGSAVGGSDNDAFNLMITGGRGEKVKKFWEKKIVEYTRLGIIDESVHGQLYEMLMAPPQFSEDGNDPLRPNTLMGKGMILVDNIIRVISRTGQFANKNYQSSDNWWKIAQYEAELNDAFNTYLKGVAVLKDGEWVAASPEREAAFEAAKEYIAKTIRATTPTYSLLPLAIRNLKRLMVVAPFISWTAEIIRLAIAIPAQSIREISGKYLPQELEPYVDKEKLRERGYRRGASFAATQIAIHLIVKTVASAFDFDDDDMEAFRRLLPSYNSNNIVIPLENKNGELSYLDVSYLIPFDYYHEPLVSFAREDGKFIDKLWAATKSLVDPFISPQVLPNAVISALANRELGTGKEIYNESDPEKFMVALAYIYQQALEPGTFDSIQRIIKALQGYEGTEGKYDVKLELLNVLGGQRIRSMKIDEKAARQIHYGYQDFQNTKRILYSVVNRHSTVSEEEIRSAWNRYQVARKEAWGHVSKTFDAGVRLGDRSKILIELNSLGTSKQAIKHITAGVIPPVTFDDAKWEEWKNKPNGDTRVRVLRELLRGQDSIVSEEES